MTWIAPEVTRVTEPHSGDERAMLEGWLDWHRQTLLSKCAGLTGEQLATRSVEPSTLSLLGLVRHMAEVERGWFRTNAAGEQLPPIFYSDDNQDGDFDDGTAASAEADFAVYHAEVELARKTAATLPLEHTFATARRPEISMRWVFLHMIEEYARHNGHADLLRQRIDGATGD
jgi:uncharacterized damage-inducible protein DinB